MWAFIGDFYPQAHLEVDGKHCSSCVYRASRTTAGQAYIRARYSCSLTILLFPICLEQIYLLLCSHLSIYWGLLAMCICWSYVCLDFVLERLTKTLLSFSDWPQLPSAGLSCWYHLKVSLQNVLDLVLPSCQVCWWQLFSKIIFCVDVPCSFIPLR